MRTPPIATHTYIPSFPILIIAIFFTGGGIGHFTSADFFIAAMPDYLGYHQELVLISGVFEIVGAIGILLPQTRQFAGRGLIALCIAVFPANVNMALHPEQFPELSLNLLYLRLPLQPIFIGFIWWATIKATPTNNKP